MFYEGDLQSGIKAAVQQAKFVTCFVRDDGAESAVWENEFLKETALVPLLLEKTLMLRLQAGSQETEFLAAIYPIPKTPALVIIHSGQLKEYLTAGISKAHFLQRVKLALNDGLDTSTPMAVERISIPALDDENDQLAASTRSQDPVPVEQEESSVATELLVERRIEKRKEQHTPKNAQRAGKVEARNEDPETAGPIEPKQEADVEYAHMQKKRQQDAQNERARILKRIEDDKAERRTKKASDQQPSTSVQPKASNLRRQLKDQENHCGLQVRLFDGTTIKSRFSPYNTLGKDVRQWVDAQRADRSIPYTFKQVLTPLSNRTITLSEEEESLRSLGLGPTANLILVPITDYASAYEGGTTSFISRGVSAGVELVSYGINMVARALGSFFGGAVASGTQVNHDDHSSPQAPSVANFRTLREPRESLDEHQFYNGNTLNFEPRRDDDNKQD